VVFLDATDVLDVSTARGWADEIDDVVRRMARLVKVSRVLSVDNCCFGAVNEYAAGSAAEWTPFRDRWNASAREELPEHALSTGPHYWKELFTLLEDNADPAPATDRNVLVDCHQYEQHDWSEIADACRAWMHQHDRLLVVGEIGPANPNWESNVANDRSQWEARYRAQGPLWSVVPWAPWTVTYGTGLALNTPGMLDLDPMFSSLWHDAASVQGTRPAAGGGGGNPEPPEPGEPFTATLTSRTDLELVVAVTAPAGRPVKMTVVENGTYAWRHPPRTVQPGEVRVQLVHHTDFAKFLCDGDDIDVPHPDDAAEYEPGDGGAVDPPGPIIGGGDYDEQDIQTAYDDGFRDGWAAFQAKAGEAFGERMEDIEQPEPPAYVLPPDEAQPKQ